MKTSAASQEIDSIVSFLENNFDAFDAAPAFSDTKTLVPDDGKLFNQSSEVRERSENQQTDNQEAIKILEAQICNLQARVRSKEQIVSNLQRELAEARRPVPTRMIQPDASVLSDRIKFVEHEKVMALQREQAVIKDRDDLRLLLKREKEALAKAVAAAKEQERPLKRLKEEKKAAEPKPRAPEPKRPQEVLQKVEEEEEVDYSKLLIKKLYAGDDIFELLQLQETDDKNAKEELLRITRDLAMKMSMMFANNATTEGLVYSIGLFLQKVAGERIVLHALGVLNTLLSSVPEARAKMVLAMEGSNWKEGGFVVPSPQLNENDPWMFLLTVLVVRWTFYVCFCSLLKTNLLYFF
jgi:hypothetical protein